MKIARVEHEGNTYYGVVQDDRVKLFIGDPSGAMAEVGLTPPLTECKLLAPVMPPNIIAIGLNYRRHAAESQMEIPKQPLMFLKANTSVIGPHDPIVLPHMAPDQVDYEAELCIVIGRTARNVSEADALDYVFGYTCGNDVSARDCQFGDKQWARGKSFDTFCPLGPWIETDIPDPENLGIRAVLNGQVMQDSSTSDLIFGCRQLVSFLSHHLTLLPGTVIMTGTPEGVGFPRNPPVYLKPGDVIEIEIDGIGKISNPVVADTASR